jgi:Zn-finger nucleic acid-binding protein
MRHLVSCKSCKRQFDASENPVNSRFRCRCGELVTVAVAQAHDSQVIRCSSCGGPREGDAAACPHCGSDFTLHERDMHTICPECCTRISDQAKYCHQCATAICPQESASEQTDLNCPACKIETRLHSRHQGESQVSALECNGCAGLWVGMEVFNRLVDRASRAASPLLTPAKNVPHTPAAPDLPPQRRGYRPCPQCGDLMVRRNYAARSGVIVDFCREHGIWFDSNELSQLLGWLHAGGDSKQLYKKPDSASEQLVSPRPTASRSSDSSSASSGYGLSDVLAEGSLEILLSGLFDF